MKCHMVLHPIWLVVKLGTCRSFIMTEVAFATTTLADGKKWKLAFVVLAQYCGTAFWGGILLLFDEPYLAPRLAQLGLVSQSS